MALVLKKFSSVLTQIYLRDNAFLIRGLPVYTTSNVKSNENDKKQEKNVDNQEKNEKKTKEDQVFSASMVARSRRQPQPPPVSQGSGPKTH